MATVGQACLILSLAVCAFGIGASLYGARAGRRDWVAAGRRSVYALALHGIAVSVDDVRKTMDELVAAEMISEVLMLSTCNRVEVYADVARFHPAVAEITTVLARHAGLAVSDLSDHLYVHFAEAAAEHIFSVASGLDSMVVGETQILGQLRAAYALAAEAGTVCTASA